MKRKSEHFFSADEKELIHKTIQNIEKTTSGEIVLMVVDESDLYPEAALLGNIVISALSALMIIIVYTIVIQLAAGWSDSSSVTLSDFLHAIFSINLWPFLALAVFFALPVRYLFSVLPKLKMIFVSKERKSDAVRDRAISLFYEKGLHRTKHETGVLIFISISERKVWILGDRGINEKISTQFWHDQASILSRGIAESHRGEAACKVMQDCAQELTRHFPVGNQDVNELPNDVISE